MSKKFTSLSFAQAKREGRKITMLTGYDYSMAKMIDSCGIDAILVGDSLGMVMQGKDSTLEVTLDEMIYHCKCVARGVENALLIGDMPFMTYHVSIEDSVRNAGRLIKEGRVNAVKLEGGSGVAPTIKAIVEAQIPVIGHIGLTPQSVNALGGFKVQGREENAARKLIKDALALEQAGASAVVLEAIPEGIAEMITQKLKIPTIGIGAGRCCDGQVLVTNDMLGMYSDFTPRFVKKYAALKDIISHAVGEYIAQVRQGDFPEEKHVFGIDEELLKRICS